MLEIKYDRLMKLAISGSRMLLNHRIPVDLSRVILCSRLKAKFCLSPRLPALVLCGSTKALPALNQMPKLSMLNGQSPE